MLIVSYGIHSYRPKLALVNAKRQWHFSFWVIPHSLLGYVRTQFDSLFVSTLFSQSALGSYHTMKYIAYIPCSHVLEPATRPLLVELSKIKDNPTYFATQFNVTLLIAMSLALPITTFLYSFSDVVVAVLLGDNWTSYSSLFGILCLVIPAYLLFHQSNRAVYVYGHTKIAAVYEILSISALIAILLGFEFDSVVKFATAKLWFETIASFSYLLFVSNKYNGVKSTVRMLAIHIPIIFACLLAYLAATHIPSLDNALLDLLTSGAIFSFVFVVTMSLFIIVLKEKNREWVYIFGLITRAAIPIMRKIGIGKKD